MNRRKRVAALCSETGGCIKDGWLCGAKILSGGTSGTLLDKESIPLGEQEARRREE